MIIMSTLDIIGLMAGTAIATLAFVAVVNYVYNSIVQILEEERLDLERERQAR